MREDLHRDRCSKHDLQNLSFAKSKDYANEVKVDNTKVHLN